MKYRWEVYAAQVAWSCIFIEAEVQRTSTPWQLNYIWFVFFPWRSPEFVNRYITDHIEKELAVIKRREERLALIEFRKQQKTERENSFKSLCGVVGEE